MYHRNLIFSIKPQIFELKCVFSYFRLKTHITLLLPVYVHSWEQRKVREVTDRYDNLRIPVAASLRVAGTTPYYGANGIQDYVDGYTHDGEFILVAEDGANDLKNYPVKCVKGRIWVNNHAHVLQGKYDCADNQFLAYAISQADIESLLVGGGRAKLNAETLMGIDLLLPNKAEQIRIGKYLAQLDNLITLHQCKCQIDGCRFQSPLAITWEQRKLGDISSLITKGTTPKDKSGTGEVNFIKVENINDFSGDIVGMSKISLEEHQGYLKRSQLQEGDILFSIAGTLGRVTSVNKAILPANTNQALSIIRLKEGNLEYVKTCLKGNVVADFIRRNPTIGAQPNLSLEQVSNLEIGIPSEAEQEKIGLYFSNLDHLITLHQCE